MPCIHTVSIFLPALQDCDMQLCTTPCREDCLFTNFSCTPPLTCRMPGRGQTMTQTTGRWCRSQRVRVCQSSAQTLPGAMSVLQVGKSLLATAVGTGLCKASSGCFVSACITLTYPCNGAQNFCHSLFRSQMNMQGVAAGTPLSSCPRSPSSGSLHCPTSSHPRYLQMPHLDSNTFLCKAAGRYASTGFHINL